MVTIKNWSLYDHRSSNASSPSLAWVDQRELAELSGVSLPTIQRMEASDGNVRGIIDSLTKVIEAFDNAGIELIGENVKSVGSGRGVRLKSQNQWLAG